MKTRNILKRICFYTLSILLMSSCMQSSQPSSGSELKLVESFVNPPESAKPWTWWHWIDGNIAKDGITSDLEAMSRSGLEGALIFNVKLGFPDGPVRFMTDEWLSMLDHAAAECDRLGLKLGIHNCDGWSQAGNILFPLRHGWVPGTNCH